MICAFVLLAAVTAGAQRRMPCIRHDEGGARRNTRTVLPDLTRVWDAGRIYRVPVVLITFKDRDFSMDVPAAYYQRLFNEPGYNEGVGKGCVADYFRDQSGGLCNLQFDIYGPVQVDTLMQLNTDKNYGNYAMRKAMERLRETEQTDFSIYDWDGNGEVDQVLFIAAGYCGNSTMGCIWPSTSFSYYKTPGGKNLTMVSISCEQWNDEHRCGIGTIIHEFSHCLGLPDLYPTSSDGGYSVVDDWDLMDGGNYINWGWCPPNYSALEKMQVGWGSRVELTEQTSISGMKPVSEGGTAYLIRNSGVADEYYLLENRRQTGWDYGIPGNGLLIAHVDYDPYAWSDNSVNISKGHRRYDFFHPDGKGYADWDPAQNGRDMGKYTMDNRLRSRYLSTTVYPYTDIETGVVIHSLTDDSDPAATLFNKNAAMTFRMSKPVTNIRMADDGTISFDFMQATGIESPVVDTTDDDDWYDLQGRRLKVRPTRKGLYIHHGKKESIR